jgi:ABC-type bacteriocin/lantibiotic exporter with double-glycine peptidase domain
MQSPLSTKRRLFVPEVVQTSDMDCGPAVLKCLLEGYGLHAEYGRLREACQTDVDGTSINVLEEIAGRLGLAAEQIMVPLDHLLLPEARSLPAILVVRLANGFTHFVLVWRRLGPFVQVMDPAVGRRWVRGRQLLEEVYVHSQAIPADHWRQWAGSEDCRRPLTRRLKDLGLGRTAGGLIDRAAADPGWQALAALDAAARWVQTLISGGGLPRGREANALLTALLEHECAGQDSSGRAEAIAVPEAFWSVRPGPLADDGAEQVMMRGAVLVRVHGRLDTSGSSRGARRSSAAEAAGGAAAADAATLSPELAAAVAAAPPHPLRKVWRALGMGWFSAALLILGLGVAAGSSLLEALLVRGAIDAGRDLGLVEQRLQALGYFLALAGALMLLDWRLARWLFRLGRGLEGRLRLAFLEKIPRLNDRYAQSRPISDMAERCHMIHQVRYLPRLGGQLVRSAFALTLTAAALAWTDAANLIPAVAAALGAMVLPLLFAPLLRELDARLRNHTGALGRFYLDALLGLTAIRAHAAERVVRREHEALLVEWARAGRRVLSWMVAIEGIQLATGFGLAVWLLLAHRGGGGEASAALLVGYWALNLPTLGEEVARLFRQYPMHRNLLMRLLEPLGAPETTVGQDSSPAGRPGGIGILSQQHGVDIALEGVTVRAAGHTILQDLDLHIQSGTQVAILGASGAGKSTLVGLLLGWHRAASGRVLVDGVPLDDDSLDRLREETAWIDPAVQLWNRSLIDNLRYGVPSQQAAPTSDVLREADLLGVLERLPDGLQSKLGGGGGLLSGGEGQRVRLGRGLGRRRARLVILDEPFRGLDRGQRRVLLERARSWWPGATLLCITHDVGEISEFDRVLLLEGGRIVEQGAPAMLRHEAGARYRRLVEAEHAVRVGLWADAGWTRLRLQRGQINSESGVRNAELQSPPAGAPALAVGSRQSEVLTPNAELRIPSPDSALHLNGVVHPAAEDHT